MAEQIGIKLGLSGAAQVQGGLKGVADALGQIDQRTLKVGDAFRALGPSIAAALSIGTVTAWVRTAVDATEQAGRLAQQVGIAVDELGGLELAFRRTGLQADQMAPLLSKLSLAVAQGNKALDAMGISTRNADGSLRDTMAVLRDVANAFAGYRDGASKTALAVALLGEEGTKLVPLLNRGAAGLAEFDRQARAMGLSVDRQAVEASKRFNEQIDLMQLGLAGLARTIAGPLVEALNKYIGIINRSNFRVFPAEIEAELRSLRARAATSVAEDLEAAARRNPRDASMRREADRARAEARQRVREADEATQRLKGMVSERPADQPAAVAATRDAPTVPGGASGKDPEQQARELLRRQQAYLADLTANADRAAASMLADSRRRADENAKTERQQALQRLADTELTAEQRARAEQEIEREYRNKIEANRLAQLRAQRDDDKRFQTEMQKQRDDAALKDQEAKERQYRQGVELNRDLRTENARLTVDLIDDEQARARARLEIDRNEAIDRLQNAGLDAEAEQLARAQVEEQFRLRRRILDRDDAAKAAEEAAKLTRKTEEEWGRTVDQISQSLADALLNGGQSAGKALQNYFRTLILQPIIRAAVDPIARSVLGMLGMGTASVGAAAQGAGAAAGAAGAGAAGGSGLLSMLGLSSAKLGVYGELFKSTGQLAMTGWGGSLQALGHAINAPLGQGLAMGAGTLAGTLGPLAIGQMLGRSMSGGYSALGGRSGSTAVNLGTAIGAVFGGPLGAGIGAVIGGIANRAFGRKLTEQGITGTFGGEAGFSGNAYTFEKGGWFRSDRTRTSALDPVMGGMLGQAFGALRTSTQAMADVLGQSGEAVRKFTTDVRINLRGLSDQQVTQRLQEEMGKLAESLADAALGTREYTRLGETQAQALTRLSGSLSAVNAALDLLNRTTLTASLQSADLASQLSDLFGGDQGLSSAVAAFQQAFYSDAERTAIATRQVTAEMAKLHLALPQTRAQFRAIVEAQDLSSEAGRKMFAALLQIAPAFDKVTASIDTVAGRLGTLAAQLVTEAQTAIQQQITASQSAANAARQAAEAYRGASATLLDTARALRGQAAPGASAAAAYRAGLAAAQGGDVTAMQGLSGLAQSYAESLRGSASSRAQYLAGTRSIAAELEAVAGTAGGLATQRGVQAALLDVNTAVLQTLAEDLQNGNLTVELLQEHSRSLASIAGALGNTGPVVQRLTGVNEGTSGVVEAQQIAGDLLASSDQTLARVLAKLSEPDANAAALAERVQAGNTLIADRLSSVIAAIGAQTAAQQAEVKRQQDLIKAQSDLRSAASYLGTLQSDLSTAQATLAGTSPTTSVRVGTRYDWLGLPKGGIYEERANPAYQTAIDAVTAAQQTLAAYAPQVDQLRELIRSLGGVPQFAAGGLHNGGLRIVGERGPELEATGPARYWSAADTTAMLGNGTRREEVLAAEIRALRAEVQGLRAEARATAENTGKTQRLMQRVTRDGESMQVTDVTPTP